MNDIHQAAITRELSLERRRLNRYGVVALNKSLTRASLRATARRTNV